MQRNIKIYTLTKHYVNIDSLLIIIIDKRDIDFSYRTKETQIKFRHKTTDRKCYRFLMNQHVEHVLSYF